MIQHLDGASAALLSYAGAAVAAVGVSAVGGDPSLFWPAALGAAVAGARTVLPAFATDSGEKPSAVGLRAFISLTAGFCTAFWGSEMLLAPVAEPARPPIQLVAFVVAAGGEFVLSIATERMQKRLKPAPKNQEGGDA